MDRAGEFSTKDLGLKPKLYEIIKAIPPEELIRMTLNHELTSLKGIAKVGAEEITIALEGAEWIERGTSDADGIRNLCECIFGTSSLSSNLLKNCDMDNEETQKEFCMILRETLLPGQYLAVTKLFGIMCPRQTVRWIQDELRTKYGYEQNFDIYKEIKFWAKGKCVQRIKEWCYTSASKFAANNLTQRMMGLNEELKMIDVSILAQNDAIYRKITILEEQIWNLKTEANRQAKTLATLNGFGELWDERNCIIGSITSKKYYSFEDTDLGDKVCLQLKRSGFNSLNDLIGKSNLELQEAGRISKYYIEEINIAMLRAFGVGLIML